MATDAGIASDAQAAVASEAPPVPCVAPSQQSASVGRPLWVVYLLTLEIGASSGILSLSDLLLSCALVSKEWHGIVVGIAKRQIKSVRISALRRRSDETVDRLARFLPGMEAVSMPGCLLVTSGALMSLSACTRLKAIDFRGCARVCDRAVSAVATGCRSLERFVAAQCPLLTDLSMLMLAQCTRLTAVEITFCPNVSPDGVQALTACGLLREASFSTGAPFGNDVFQALGRNCRSLETLYVGNASNTTLPGLAAVGLLTRLRHLSLKRCELATDAGLMHLSYLPALELFQISNAPLITDGGLAAVVARCKSLRRAAVVACANVNGAFLFRAAVPDRVRGLSLSRCPKVDDLALSKHVTAFVNLDALDVSGTSATDVGLSAVFEKCASLRFVCADGCRGVGDDAIADACRRLDRLAEMSVEGCEGVTDGGLLRAAARRASELQRPMPRLRLTGCPRVTQRGVAAAGVSSAHLRTTKGGAQAAFPFAATNSGEAWFPFGASLSW